MNKWIGAGRLTRAPEIRYSQGETSLAIARYTLAIDRIAKQQGEHGTDFIPCVAFGKLAEFADKNLVKGQKIIVEGRIQTGSYTNKEGKKVYTTEIVVERQEFCESLRAREELDPNNNQEFMNVPDDLELPFQ